MCSQLGFASLEHCRAPFQSVLPFQSGQTFEKIADCVSGNSLDGSVVDVGEQVGLLLLAVALPQQQLLHCRKRQAHHDLYYSEIVSHNTTKSIDKTSSEETLLYLRLTNSCQDKEVIDSKREPQLQVQHTSLPIIDLQWMKYAKHKLRMPAFHQSCTMTAVSVTVDFKTILVL